MVDAKRDKLHRQAVATASRKVLPLLLQLPGLYEHHGRRRDRRREAARCTSPDGPTDVRNAQRAVVALRREISVNSPARRLRYPIRYDTISNA